MKKEIIIHFSFLVSFFIFASIVKDWFSISFIPFWLGGILGTLLPDVDHLIYIYFLRPQELTSQRVNYLVTKGNIVKTFQLLATTREERKHLIFHTTFFQIIFLILTFLVLTSSGSLFGSGLVLAFSLHLVMDMVVDLNESGNLDNWFEQIPIELDTKQKRWYLIASICVLLIFGFFL